jgi:excisionase family DNA binding protein
MNRTTGVGHMPHEQMTEQQLAEYLRLDLRQILKWAARGQIPCRKVGDEKFLFRRSDVDHWVWQRMHDFDRDDREGIERGVSEHQGCDPDQPIVCPLIPEAGCRVPLDARTRQSAIDTLLDIAETCDLLYNRQELREELRGREQLCSTALLPRIAFPHPRHPLPYDIAESFIVVGLTPTGIPFGAEDGSLTRLFFLVCCKDERTHLHVLARLVRMLDQPQAIELFLSADDGEHLCERLAHREMEVLNTGG